MPTTVVTIDGTDYDATDRADGRWAASHMLTKHLDGGYDTFEFSLYGVDPEPNLFRGKPITLTIDSAVVFRGTIARASIQQTNLGWSLRFTAYCLKYLSDHIPVTAGDGSGTIVYNRSPLNDPMYVPSDAGLTVGAIIKRVLESQTNASLLADAGVGNWATPGPIFTLPTDTLDDLALLDVVPPRPVILEGPGLISEIEALATKWHPKYSLFIRPDGTIRVVDCFDLTVHSLVIPGESGDCDPVSWPSLSFESEGCYTAAVAIGRDVQMAVLSVVEGTMAEGWDSGDEATWTIDDFLKPIDCYSYGDVTSLTTTQATVDPDDDSHHWASNFWQTRVAHITLIYPGGAGVDIMENRQVTACSALSAGGTGTVSWDASYPLPNTDYTRFILIGTAGAKVDVGRLYYVRDPNTGDVGTNTFIGPRLLPAAPRPMSFGNNGRVASAAAVGAAGGLASGPVCQIIHSPSGSPPYFAYPTTLQVVPSIGAIRLDEPAAKATSLLSQLQSGYPTTYADGKPVDVVAMVPYNRGGLTARAPSSGYEGSAYDIDGLERVLYLFIDDWTLESDASNMVKLCREHLDTTKDVVVEGSISHHGYPTDFDPLDMGYALNLSIAGKSVSWDSLDLPVRSVTVRWNPGGGMLHSVDFNFSNRKRPFQGSDLYVHASTYPGAGSSGQMPFDHPLSWGATPDTSASAAFAGFQGAAASASAASDAQAAAMMSAVPKWSSPDPASVLPPWAFGSTATANPRPTGGSVAGAMTGGVADAVAGVGRRSARPNVDPVGPPREMARTATGRMGPKPPDRPIRPAGPPRELAPRGPSKDERQRPGRDVGKPGGDEPNPYVPPPYDDGEKKMEFR